ncbi:hypothetical protein SCALM49S_07795 [Streptomyces californicus]
MALVGRREAELKEVAESIRAAGGTALPLALDLAEEGAPADAVAMTAAALGPVGLLVCSAGAIRLAAVHETEERHWERQLRVNLTVPFLLAREVLPGMRERGCGWVVNIGSGVGSEVVPGSGGYGVSKHAVHRLTELIHEENRDRGVRAVTVAPGWVSTPARGPPRRSRGPRGGGAGRGGHRGHRRLAAGPAGPDERRPADPRRTHGEPGGRRGRHDPPSEPLPRRGRWTGC